MPVADGLVWLFYLITLPSLHDGFDASGAHNTILKLLTLLAFR